jgi:hypothetical protein
MRACKVASITYNPTERQLEKAGLFESSEAIMQTAMLDWMDANIQYDDIDITRCTVDILPIEVGLPVSEDERTGTMWEIKAKSRSGAYANGYLYITFSLKRRG